MEPERIQGEGRRRLRQRQSWRALWRLAKRRSPSHPAIRQRRKQAGKWTDPLPSLSEQTLPVPSLQLSALSRKIPRDRPPELSLRSRDNKILVHMGGVVFLPSLPQVPVTQRSAAVANVAKFLVAGLPGADIADDMEARGYPWARTCASLLRADSQLETVCALAACWPVCIWYFSRPSCSACPGT